MYIRKEGVERRGSHGGAEGRGEEGRVSHRGAKARREEVGDGEEELNMSVKTRNQRLNIL